ncbi:hypothetical protein [Gordonia effusa]|uniref:hypothetical protein n=1 Tax=Gordonia effusa TaxID=263908 RepID=UPI001FE18FB8|nr:hypothetical protein [Gordonia effusa]
MPKPNATPVSVIDTLQAANDTLAKLGIKPFLWPTIAPFCSETGAPLGIVPAVAGAVTGPYTPLVGSIPPVLGNDLNTVKSGEVLYGFVPAGIVNDSGDKKGMNVAWFNVNSFQGGFVPMGSLSDVVLKPIDDQIAALGLLNNPITKLLVDNALKPLKAALNDLPQAGVRAATVKTGQGLVLSAILGTVKNGANTCFFLPTVGIQQVG